MSLGRGLLVETGQLVCPAPNNIVSCSKETLDFAVLLACYGKDRTKEAD